MSVRLFIGNLPYYRDGSRTYASICRASANPRQLSSPSTGKPAARAASRSSTTRIAAVAEEAISRFDQQPFKGRPLAVSEARPREDAAPAAPRPGGFGGPPRPGGFSGPRPADRWVRRRGPSGWAARDRLDGGGAPVADRAAATSGPTRRRRTSARRRTRTRDRGPKGPIKERPVSRLYDNDEDWRNEKPDEDIDDIATSAKVDPEGDQDDE